MIKIKNLSKKFKDKYVLKDINLDLHVDETGKNCMENAYIKAKAYYDKTKIISIGMDNSLFIENLPPRISSCLAACSRATSAS